MARIWDSKIRTDRPDRTKRVVLIVTSLLAGCVSTGGYMMGQVMDADTRKPISDAHVAITWNGDQFAFVETKSVCIHADATETDVAGKFRFMPWVRGVLPITDVDYQLSVYKRGYEGVGQRPMEALNSSHFMKPINTSAENNNKRVEYLMNLLGEVDCGPSTFDLNDFIPMFRAIYQEALQIGTENELRLMRNEIAQIWSGAENTMTYGESEKFFDENIRERLQ